MVCPVCDNEQFHFCETITCKNYYILHIKSKHQVQEEKEMFVCQQLHLQSLESEASQFTDKHRLIKANTASDNTRQ